MDTAESRTLLRIAQAVIFVLIVIFAIGSHALESRAPGKAPAAGAAQP